MFTRLASAALLAGFLAAVVTTLLQLSLTSALILKAETFEGKAADAGRPVGQAWIIPAHTLLVHDHGADGSPSHDDAEEWQPGEGLPRMAFTGLAALVGGVGCAFLLGAMMMALKFEPTPERGLALGIAGFAAVALAPSIGLPPELPGMGGASLGARQIWWVLTVLATGLGLYLLVVHRTSLTILAGLLLIAVPHLIGAPHGAPSESKVPAELAAQFAARSLGISFVFWTVIGLSYGWVWNRLSQDGQIEKIRG